MRGIEGLRGARKRRNRRRKGQGVGDQVWQLVDSSTIGGIETHVGVLAAALRRAGWDAQVVLLADHGPNPWLAQLDARGVPHTVLAGGLGGLLAALRRGRPALLHTHGYKAGILGRLAARLSGTPCVSTFHAGERGPFPVSLYQTLDAWTSVLAPRIAVSAPIARNLPFGAEVIGNFVPVPAARRLRAHGRMWWASWAASARKRGRTSSAPSPNGAATPALPSRPSATGRCGPNWRCVIAGS